MGNKQISIPDDVYERLNEERRPDESFGDVIDRLVGPHPLSEFWGAWSDETVEDALAAIETSRERSAEHLE